MDAWHRGKGGSIQPGLDWSLLCYASCEQEAHIHLRAEKRRSLFDERIDDDGWMEMWWWSILAIAITYITVWNRTITTSTVPAPLIFIFAVRGLRRRGILIVSWIEVRFFSFSLEVCQGAWWDGWTYGWMGEVAGLGDFGSCAFPLRPTDLPPKQPAQTSSARRKTKVGSIELDWIWKGKQSKEKGWFNSPYLSRYATHSTSNPIPTPTQIPIPVPKA